MPKGSMRKSAGKGQMRLQISESRVLTWKENNPKLDLYDNVFSDGFHWFIVQLQPKGCS